MSRFWSDFRFAARQILRAPAFTLLVVLTLALGVGANVAIFSFVRGVLLRPLPYPEPDQLVLACETHLERPDDWCGASPANLADWSRTAKSFDSMALARTWPFSAKIDGANVAVRGGIATAGLFRVLRAQPAAGRLFLPRDMDAGSSQVAIVSHSFWTRRLGGKPDAVGMSFALDGEDYQIVGVLPQDFEAPLYLTSVDMWIPLWPERQTWRNWRGFLPFARLADGVTLEQARAEMAAIRASLADTYAEDNAAWNLKIESLHDWTVRRVKPALLLFLIAAGLVLLVACANVANLLLARSSTREREVAVRLAMGAGRRGVLRQLLTESLLLALLGSLTGIILAVWLVDLFIALAPAWFPRLELVQVDGPALLFGLLLTALTSLLFGLAPAIHSSDMNPSETLRGARSTTAGRAAGRIRSLLVVTEVALAVVLLVGAGLLLRSFAQLLDWQPGFDRNNLVMVSVFNSPAKYPQGRQVGQLHQRAVAELAQIPGIVSASAASAGPLFGGDGEQEFQIEGQPEPPAGQKPVVAWFDVEPGYFRTLGIPFVEGRDFTDRDTRDTPTVGIVNEAMARRHWPGRSPIGQRLHMAASRFTLEIVGVVSDVKPFRPDQAAQPEIYWPHQQAPRWAIHLIARTSTDPASVIPAIRARMAQLDPDMELGRFFTMTELVDRQLVNPRFNMTLLVIFAVVAATLAMVGVYGVMAFFVAQRTQEIGVRMALGALPRDIFRMVLRHGGKLALAGLVAGLLLALALTSLMRSLLIGIAPTDPLTFIGAGVLLLAVGLLACWLPARRATRVDPMVALHYE